MLMRIMHRRFERLNAKARLMNSDIADVIVSSARVHYERVNDEEYVLGAWLYTFPSDGFFALPPEGLSEFWRLFVEAVFNLDFVAFSSHPLVFHDVYGGHELEVTDEWGDAWWIVMGPVLRSECSTPLRRRSSVRAEPYLDLCD